MTTRASFERDLQQLKDGVVRMGEQAGEAIHGAVEALRARDVAAAERIIAEDDALDALHMDLEQRCMRLLATQQPMAGDLRTITSVFAITIDLERMADHAEGISRAVKRVGAEPPVKPLVDIPQMDETLQGMIRDALMAFQLENADLARQTAAQDDVIDRLRNRVLHDLLDIMIHDPQTVPRALELLIVARHLERAADHVTNICERIVYIVTGEMRELNV
jgi:phosphate transport system protein